MEVRLVAAAVDARGADPLARTVARLRDGDAILLLDACELVVQDSGASRSGRARRVSGRAGTRDKP